MTQPAFPPPPARQRRPSGWWFVAGGALVVSAIVAFVGLFAWTLTSFNTIDERVAADGRPHQIRVSGDDDRMLWVDEEVATNTSCTVADLETGEMIPARPPGATFTRSANGRGWIALARYRVGSGSLEVTCPAALVEVELGPAPEIGGFVGGILATILLPMVLGGSGVVVLIVTGVLFATGRSRSDPTAR